MQERLIVKKLENHLIRAKKELDDANEIYEFAKHQYEDVTGVKLNNEPIYEYEDVIEFIKSDTEFPEELIDEILRSEEKYMKSIGIIK